MRLPLVILATSLATGLAAQTATPPHPATRPKTAGAKSTTASAAAKPVPKKPAAAPALMTDDDKTIYALGLSIYRSIGPFNLSPAELDIVKRALSDAAANKPAESIETWGPKIQAFAQTRAAKVAEVQKAASQAYLAKAAAAPGAVAGPSGLIYRELRPGTGPAPKSSDTVKVNYRGTLVDGTEFDSSYKRNEATQFPLTGVIPCWTQGLQMMKVGGKAELVCPASIAYGDAGRPGIPPGATLTFEIELLDIIAGAPSLGAPGQPPPPPPHD